MKKYHHQKIEKKWQSVWRKERIYEPSVRAAKKPFYNLMMFPYPSAEGLHVGNMYAFTGSDVYGRFKRMQGYDVFEPIGLDGFGIHSENYALKIGAHPAKQARKSEQRFYRQLEMIGNGFAWERKVETYDPQYYKWTQWIFKKMFDSGLAYRKQSPVNWCPHCRTVLADEQVINNRCERCDTEIVQKNLEQWFFRITKYADKLLKPIPRLNWAEKVKIAQRDWIGRSVGAVIKFKIQNSKLAVPVFTTRPDTLFGATYLVLAPEHSLLVSNRLGVKNYREVEKYIKQARKKTEHSRVVSKVKTGVELKGVKAVNPANGDELPVWTADYVLASYGAGAVMAVPAHDKRDFEFAQKYGLKIRPVIKPETGKQLLPYEGEGILFNSGRFNGLKSKTARKEIVKFVGGKMKVNYRLRDWLISRQRYWGPPIPMVFCQQCREKIEKLRTEKPKRDLLKKYSPGELENPGWFSVPESELPVKLPFVKNFKPLGKGESPLATVKSFYQTQCPRCGASARRETDVSDTFLDSAWFYYRYLDSRNDKRIFSRQIAKKWLPVDMYIGGAEHAVMHLLYTRFITKVFKDWKLISFDEPFRKFRANGLIIKEGRKMSKSKGNVVNPDEYIKKYGADVLRAYLMFLAPFEQGGDFRDAGIIGIIRFFDRVWNFFNGPFQKAEARRDDLQKILHRTIKKVTSDIESLQYNTALSALMELFREMEKSSQVSRAAAESFLKMLAPFAPHLTEEIWREILKNRKSIHIQKWPRFNRRYLTESAFNLIIQLNGKFKGVLAAPKGISKDEAAKLALNFLNQKKSLTPAEVKKIIFVPDKLINFIC